MTEADKAHEGREEKIATQIARKIAAIPENKPEHAADHKLRAIEEIIENTIKMVERHTGKELRDQLSKERESVKHFESIAVENKKLFEKEREMRKELSKRLFNIHSIVQQHYYYGGFIKPSTVDEIKEIASELDKN